MPSTDLYSILGVLPDAEDIVITAAYRALAQRYHPDKWRGDPAEAHKRMSEINEAYRILGDRKLRVEYNHKREAKRSQDFQSSSREEYDEAFSDALCELEERWAVAVSIFPDLATYRASLARISTSLAFSYVAGLLATKQFEHRGSIAAHLEQTFLERYFGSNGRVVDYARSLIVAGNREAARALNRLVEVVGSDVDAELLVCKIDEAFGVRVAREKVAQTTSVRRRIEALANTVRRMGYYDEACELAGLHGYATSEVGGGLFRSPEIFVTSPTGGSMSFTNSSAFVKWVQDKLC